jgi:hypothetical protein
MRSVRDGPLPPITSCTPESWRLRTQRRRRSRTAGDEIDIANDFGGAPQRAGDFGARNAGQFPDRSPEAVSFGGSDRMEQLSGRFSKDGDASQDLRCGLLTEPGKARKSAVARRLQVRHGFEAESGVNAMDPGWTEPGDAKHFDQPFGCGFPQLIEIAGVAGLDEIGEDGEGCRSYSWQISDGARTHQWRDVFVVESLDRACGSRKGP